MKSVVPQDSWPDSWKYSHPYDLQEVYGEIRHFGYAYSYANRRKHTLALLTEVLPPGATVLDIAAAQGNFTLTLAELGYRVTWNDLRGDLADYVRLKHERGEVHFAPGNAFELSFPALFDAVLITEVIEHVAHPDRFLAQSASLVRPGGYVVMTTPNGRYCRNRLPKFSDCPDPSIYESVQFKPNADGHIFLLHPDEIPGLAAKAGLRVDALRVFTNPLTHGHVKLETALKILPRRLVEGLESLGQKVPQGFSERLHAQMGVRFQRPL